MHVIATAGHVDHGKSTLVRALTGMEPDRWAEERRRGMTIDLGYAWMTLPAGERLAFVDVPGHERFVPNMLAGLGPVPAVMFVVAADGGWMPQSVEHLAAVDALGVRHGVVVITRCDLADPGPATRLARAEIARTSLGPVEAIAVSAVTGQGLDDLRAALARLTAQLTSSGPAGGPAAPVRLWIDRSFTIKGSGTVVTGTLPAGTVANGQELLLTPSEEPVRVRALQSLGEPADRVTGVARVALNLRGVPAGRPGRGMALTEPGRWTLSAELDVRITPRAGDPRPRFPPELLLHLGSARSQARVRILGTVDDERTGNPVSYARLRLRDPLPLHAGDRVLLRDPGAAGLAIYGAIVLDPAPPPLARRGAGAAAVRELAAWPDAPAAAHLLGRHKLLRAGQLAAAGVSTGVPVDITAEIPAGVATDVATDVATGGGQPAAGAATGGGQPAPVVGDWYADPGHWASLRARLPTIVAEFCARDPLAPGMPVEAARAALALPSRDLVTALVRPPVTLDGGYLSPAPAPDAPPVPPVPAGVQAVLDDLADDPFAAPDAGRLRELGLDLKAVATAARAGLLLRVADMLVLAPGADKAAAARLAQLDQPFTTSQARQALRTTRRVVIPLLEYLDRNRITERLPGDLRRIRP